MTTATALGNLRDAIRAEIAAELVEKLKDLVAANLDNDHYVDGVNDAIATIQEG